ncbi:MAG: hypothetical protein WKF75_07375 [Singulisphaera sp.]
MGPFRLRTLIMLVALMAVLMGGVRTGKRWGHYRGQAAYHARIERRNLDMARDYLLIARQGNNAAACRRLAALRQKEATHHARLRQEYESRW